MTEQQLKLVNGTDLTVEWRGQRDFEKALGHVTALIYRRRENRDILSVEITQESSPKSVIICLPEQIYPIGKAADWQNILSQNKEDNCEIQHTEKLAESPAESA